MIVTLIDDFVLADLRLTGHTLRNFWQCDSHLVGLARLLGKAILVCLWPRILIERVCWLGDVSSVTERHLEIDVKR